MRVLKRRHPSVRIKSQGVKSRFGISTSKVCAGRWKIDSWKKKGTLLVSRIMSRKVWKRRHRLRLVYGNIPWVELNQPRPRAWSVLVRLLGLSACDGHLCFCSASSVSILLPSYQMPRLSLEESPFPHSAQVFWGQLPLAPAPEVDIWCRWDHPMRTTSLASVIGQWIAMWPNQSHFGTWIRTIGEKGSLFPGMLNL